MTVTEQDRVLLNERTNTGSVESLTLILRFQRVVIMRNLFDAHLIPLVYKDFFPISLTIILRTRSTTMLHFWILRSFCS